MSVRDAYQKMQELSRRRQKALEEISEVARSLVPILKDHNLGHTASELSEKLFQYDALEQEMTAFMREDPKGFVEGMVEHLERNPKP